jgi:regulator of sirC expression with transglutaminase-like and TPR domain
MLDRDQIPHLVKLLDDESPSVREQVVRELRAFADLDDELRAFDITLTSRQRAYVNQRERRDDPITIPREAWLRWPMLPTPREQLEAALELLARFQYGWTPPVRLGDLLDELAREFLASGKPRDPIALSRFLFVTKGIAGDLDDYYHPMNSNVVHVIQEKKGLPLSLACVFILAAYRIGLDVAGCNVPGHFLARGSMNGAPLYFDCFGGGRLLSTKEVAHLQNRLGPIVERIMAETPTPVAIVRRVLHNLLNAYTRAENKEYVDAVQELLGDLPNKPA